VKKQNWKITPMNEGHDIDYSERLKGTRKAAKERAEDLRRKLQRALPKATISVRVTKEGTEEEFTV